jgi:F-type H+-transporting ATPase subunit delta
VQKGVEKLAKQLLAEVYSTTELKKISLALEGLSHATGFKSDARTIVSNARLSDEAKATQLLALLKEVDIPTLQSFFTGVFSEGEFWLFSSKQFDYFDEFVRAFQLATEQVLVVQMVIAIEMYPREQMVIAQELGKSLERQVVLDMKLNPAIVGGAQIRIGNLVFDYTLRSKFNQFERQWITRMARTAALVGE